MASPRTFTVAEGNFGATVIAGQSFLATNSGPISNVQILIGGADNLYYDVHLYNVRAAAPAQAGSTTYTTALPDLMPADTAEGKGFEPSTGFPAPDFESGR